MDDVGRKAPTNVRVVDRVTAIETPVDTVYSHTEEDGTAMFRVVNLPEWFHPERHGIEVDEVPGSTGILVPVPEALIPSGLRKATDEINNEYNRLLYDLFYAEISAWVTRLTAMLLLMVLTASYSLHPEGGSMMAFWCVIAWMFLTVLCHTRTLRWIGRKWNERTNTAA